MPRPFPVALAVTLTLTALPGLLAPCVARAADAPAVGQAREASTPPDTPLPVRSVTLFSSGVSYTLREGEVNGDATVPLSFRTAQINDILKSMVLLDENGTVRPAVYAAKDPIGRTLQSFAVDVTQPTSRAELLNKLRGAQVTVEAGGMVIAASTTTERITITGRIVGVESKPVTLGGNQTTTVETLTVLGNDGLQSVRLDEVRSIRLLDNRLNHEFQEALSLLSAGSDDRRRQVTLHFDGNGRRRVRVGYVSEAPLWKISYRLLIGGTGAEQKGGDGKPYLQGWALVENTTDEDWTDVRLSLVSGRPVSFIQDLYQPLYLPRPVVPPDVVASPYPQLAEANVEEKAKDESLADKLALNAATSRTESRMAAGAAPAATPSAFGFGRGGVGGGGGFGGGAAPMEMMRRSVEAQATGEKAGELFQYNISTPVTLPRQQAAMIPVIAQDIAGDKVSLYNADTDARFPLNAFRIKNDTPLHLKGGPVTLFDNGVYAGDARMEDIPPGDTRLITYAVDLAVEGERQGPLYSGIETSLVIRRGVLIITRRERQETRYTLRNKAAQSRTVLVEHPFSAEYKLVQPEKAESRTPQHYRFAVLVPPGKSEKLIVVTERPVSESLGLIDQDLNAIEIYTKRGDVNDKIKDALREVLTRRRHIQDLQGQAAAAEAEVTSIDRDQDRIRKNMTALDKSSALYKRYVTQLDEQETRIQALRTEANRLRTAAAAADRDLRAYLDTLNLTP